jgi:predicted AlkP superfamily pyrophosphatase or phosphodiesterase
LITRNVVSRDQLVNFRKAPITWRDSIWTEAAIHILTAHKPNLMLFHVLNMDSTHHRYGPMELASYNAFAFADDRVKQVRDALAKARLLDRTTLLVVSDHGFRTVNKLIQADAVLESKGVSGAWVVPEGGTAMVYATDPAERAALMPRIADAFRVVEGVEAVIGRDEFRRLGLNPDSKESPDLVLAAKPGYAFSGGKVSSASPFRGGSHGYLNTDSQMDAIFVAWGAGIRRGARLGQVSVMDLGPTIAKLLGLEMSDVQGHVLREILE